MTSRDTLDQLLPTIRYDVIYESDKIRDSNFANHYRIRQSASVEDNIPSLEQFLAVGPEVARQLAETPYLFAD